MKVFRRPGRAAIVMGAFAAVALAAGTASVLAGSSGTLVGPSASAPVPRDPTALKNAAGRPLVTGRSYRNDVSKPVRSLPKKRLVLGVELEASPNPWPVSNRKDVIDGVRQTESVAPNMPAVGLQFDGIAIPAPGCAGCYPPDTNGEVGLTQYVQSVNVGFQVFDKATGDPVTSAVTIASL
ncbi:MAG: hypothetical protein ACJ74S_00865, partial [Gaiellaceae bacterium]